jgi:acetate kinase
VKVLVLNAGSSTLKFSLFESDGEQTLAEGLADWGGDPARLVLRRPGAAPSEAALSSRDHAGAAERVLHGLLHADPPLLSHAGEVAVVGHRVVHGGEVYTDSVRITDSVKATIAQLAELAPLHNPANLEGIRAVEAALPGVPQVAVFDTAFHATLPPAARTYPVPHAWTEEWRLRRYGFHGISHAYCSGRAAELVGRRDGLRVVVCHLGNGCSASAVRGGVCVDTSMGFTPLEGLMMGTRSGSVDPGLMLYVLRHRGLTPEQLEHTLQHGSGLLGVSGVSSDMRQVLAAAHSGDARARLALEVYAHRVRQTIGAMAATLGGVDALVFTAGVGENAAEVREMACRGLGGLGLELDAAANATRRPDADVATPASPGRILILATREDLVIVREAVRLVRGG